MVNSRHSRSLGFALCCWIAGLIFANGLLAEDTQQAADLRRWGRLLVLPVYDMTAIYGKDASVRGPISRQVFVTGEVQSEADLQFNRILERRLAQKKGLAWQAGTTLAADLNPSTSVSAHLKAISELGRRSGADHVLIGYLYAFRQREGGNYGARTPAKVVFELVVVRTENRRVVGQRRYDETQQALSDNLLNLGKFIRRKGRWISAREMAEQAVKDMLDNLFIGAPAPQP